MKALRRENRTLKRLLGLLVPRRTIVTKRQPIIVQKDTTQYVSLMERVKKEASMITLTYKNSQCDDGRITSALKEREYLERLKVGLEISNSDIVVDIPGVRCWYDVKINDIPINLKITTGSTDNAFNKTAIYYTITGRDDIGTNLNFNGWWARLKEAEKKEMRDPESEYHYLVVDKNSGAVLLKSILDIHTYKSNPSNILQINWRNEFVNEDYQTPPLEFKNKQKELVSVIQSSVSQNIINSLKFAAANLSDL